MESKMGAPKYRLGIPARKPPPPFSLHRIFSWGWRIGLMESGHFLPSIFVALCVQLLHLWNAQLLSNLVTAIGSSRKSGIGFAAFALAATTCGLILLQFLDRGLTLRTDTRLLRRIQILLHDRIHAAPLSFHETHDASRLQMTIVNYASGAESMLKEAASFPIVRIVGLGSALYLLWKNLSAAGTSDLWLRFVLFGVLLVLPLAALKAGSKVRSAFQDVQAGNAEVALRVGNSLRSPVEVRSLGVAGRLMGAFSGAVDRLSRAKIRANLRNEALTQFQSAVPTILQLVFLMVAAWQILRATGPVEVGSLLAIYYFVPEVVAPLREMVSFYSGLQANWPMVAEVLELLEQPDDPLEPINGGKLPDAPCEMELRRTSFRYVKDGPLVLDELDAVFPAGKATAIIGRSGSGKSTVFGMLSRQLAPASGNVRIGGQDLAKIASASLRERMFKASQFPLFLTGTLRENLALVAPEATDEQMERACREVGLWEAFLRSGGDLPPLDRPMPTDPTKGLSGGERKRFVLARAILASPQLLLLDEPTSGLAPSDRREIANVLRRNFSGKTLLIVDHDMEFVRETADFVLCLEGGRATDFGAPVELMARDSLLRRLTESVSIGEDAQGRPVG